MIQNKVFKNASWIIGCKIIQSILTFVVTLLTARYLGPSNYGLVNYAASITAFVAPIVKLGLENTQVKELVNAPEKEGEIVGTTITLSVISALFCVIGVVAFSFVANVGETVTIIVCALYSIILFFQSAELLQYWFQAKYISKYASLVTLFAFAVVTTYRIVLLIKKINVYWFAVANAMDYIIITLLLIVFYYRLGGKKLRFSIQIAKQMLSKSKYYIIPNLMVVIFTQSDRIMLKLMIDEAATGIYSAAVSCASLANFVFTAIVDSFSPMIYENHKKSKEKFENSMEKLYSITLYLALAEAAFVCLFASLMIKIIYGAEYIDAILPLRVVAWYVPLSFIGNIRNVWMLAEGKQKYLLYINLVGAVGNIILNCLLIPVWGILGAAVTSLLTQFLANVLVSFALPQTRYNTYLMLRGLNPKHILSMLKR